MRAAALRTALTALVVVPLMLSVVLTGGPAAAASSGRIVSIEESEGRVQVVFQASDLPDGASIDLSSVHVRVGDQVLRATAKPLAASTEHIARTAVLAVDNSRSMRSRLDSAKAAANAFLDRVPDDVQVGLVTFNDDVQLISKPTSDRDALRAKIARLTVEEALGTALYDGASLALGAAGSTGARSILMLTDGDESGSSNSPLSETVSKITSAKVTLDAVYIGPDNTPPADLTNLVSGVDGRVLSSGTDQLADIFAQAGQAISSQIQISAAVPAELAESSADLTVSATAAGSRLTDSALATFGKPYVAPRHFGPRKVSASAASGVITDTTLPVALGILFVGMLILLTAAFTGSLPRDGKQGRLRRRLSIYTLTGRTPQKKQEPTTTVLGNSQVARSAVQLASKVVQRRDFESNLAKRLEAAGLPLRAAEWILVHIGIAFGLALLLLLISGAAILPSVIGLVVGLVLPWLYLGLQESRRTSAFLSQLPDTLQLISGSLSAGYTMPQAMDSVVREGQQPITGEFNRVLVETKLGVPLEDALEGVAARMQSKDFAWVVMAIRIQREVGGNLAELLTTVAATLRERERLRRQVSVLSAEGRLSGWILCLLPVVFGTYLAIVRPDYLRPLVTETLGWLMLGTGVILLTVGALWMRKSIKVEV